MRGHASFACPCGPPRQNGRMAAPVFRVGCSGWSYRHWRGSFYPRELPTRRWFEHYTRRFDTVELNTTFYRLPSEKAVESWRDQAPPGFSFAVKASRLVTHFHRLANAEEAMETLWERLEPLGPMLGPMLFQLPPKFSADPARLRTFLESLPKAINPVFEFRDDSWWNAETYRALENAGAGFAMYDMGETRTPVLATSSTAYLRFHGPGAKYDGSYSEDALRSWHRKLARLEGVETAWVYFNNDIGGHAPRNAETFRAIGRRG